MLLNRKKIDLDATQIEKHEKEVLSVMSTLESAVNPFEVEQTELVHLTSGLVATEDVKSDLLTAKERGEQPALSQSGEISPDFCCFYGGGIRHNENIMHSFQNFIVRLIPNHPPPPETTIWKLVVRALGATFTNVY